MAEENLGEKTEQPTPKRIKELREKGEVAKSRELPSVAVLLAGLVGLSLFSSYMYANMQILMKESLSEPMLNILIDPNEFMVFVHRVMKIFMVIVCPIMGAVCITAVLSNVLQVGFILSAKVIKPKASKINPIKGFERLFSKQSMMELFKTLLKLGIVGVVAYLSVKGEMENLLVLGGLEFNVMVRYIAVTILGISIKCSLAMVFIVVLDYAFQHWDFQKRIKMSKQEIKDEFKKSEGDPLIKARIKSIQMEMARRRMMQAVPEADVVITNPTHLAVAIKYDSMQMGAPKVLAKGPGAIAGRIKSLAEKHGIPIVENKPLAQNLYKLVDIGREIPPSLFHAVAEVLAYIYKLKQVHRTSGLGRQG
jgi:flagellar biosynthesis protein FlhB